MARHVDISDIMKASFGETSNIIRSSFKKTIQIKQYETEVFEGSTTLELDKNITGIERMLINAILNGQIEYEIAHQMFVRKAITESEVRAKKENIEKTINDFKQLGEKLLGKDLDYIFDLISNEAQNNPA